MQELHNPADMPDPVKIDHIEEPWIKATIMVPDEFLGPVLKLCEEKRGIQQDLTYVGGRAMVVYRLPLAEVVFDFYDRLKSATRGYASFDYQMEGYGESDLVKLTILVNKEPVDALSIIVHRDMAESPGAGHLRALEGSDSAPALPDRDSGGDRRAHCGPLHGQGHAQGCPGQVLWR